MRVAVVAALGCVVAEIALRRIVLSSSSTVLAAARRPELYGNGASDDLYWEVQSRVNHSSDAGAKGLHDARVGWVSERFLPQTYEHQDELALDTRRAIWWLGDSYSHCVTPDEESFQASFAASELSSDYSLLNFGVGGYGTDQVLLLLRELFARGAQPDPLIAIGILVGDDLDRCWLGFRVWPKPRFELVDGRLELRGVPAPTNAEYFAKNAPFARSFLWAALSARWNRSRFGARSFATLEERKAELARAVLREIVATLEAHAAPHVFVLFQNRPSLGRPERLEWRTTVVREELIERGESVIDVGAAMYERAGGSAELLDSWYGGAPHYEGHLNVAGQRVANEIVLAGLRRAFDLHGRGVAPSVERFAVTSGGVAGHGARFVGSLRGELDGAPDPRRIAFDLRSGAPVEIEYDLGRLATEFTARARFAGGSERGSVGLSVVVDGAEVVRRTLRGSDDPFELRVALDGASLLRLRVDDAGDGTRGDAFVLEAPRFALTQREH